MKSHILFPVLDYMAKTIYQQEHKLNKMELDIKTVLSELHQLQEEKLFDVKKSSYAVSLNSRC